ncbi:MAG: AraC family transcriptional regulator [Desulfotomaculaceae bacterium]|nr:AraC family transcriptional regulator [Desulfotomaculaceae bacterium]
MNDLKARVAYLQGLSAGLDLETDSKEGKLFKGIIEVLGDVADTVGDLEEGQGQLEDYLETIDEDLYQLEDELYENDADHHHSHDMGNYIEVKCPGCGENVYFDSHVTEDDDVVEVTCPNCDEVVFVKDESFEFKDEPEALEGQVTGDNLEHGKDVGGSLEQNKDVI